MTAGTIEVEWSVVAVGEGRGGRGDDKGMRDTCSSPDPLSSSCSSVVVVLQSAPLQPWRNSGQIIMTAYTCMSIHVLYLIGYVLVYNIL